MKLLLILKCCLLINLIGHSQPISISIDSAFYNLFIEEPVEIEYQNWFKEKDSLDFPQGSFYLFTSNYINDAGEPIVVNYNSFSIDMLLGFLIAKGMKINEAWHKRGRSQCEIFDTMVFPAILINAKDSSQEMDFKKYGFRKVNEPTVGDCPISVKHYIFNKK